MAKLEEKFSNQMTESRTLLENSLAELDKRLEGVKLVVGMHSDVSEDAAKTVTEMREQILEKLEAKERDYQEYRQSAVESAASGLDIIKTQVHAAMAGIDAANAKSKEGLVELSERLSSEMEKVRADLHGSGESGKQELLAVMDANKDGSVDKDEFSSWAAEQAGVVAQLEERLRVAIGDMRTEVSGSEGLGGRLEGVEAKMMASVEELQESISKDVSAQGARTLELEGEVKGLISEQAAGVASLKEETGGSLDALSMSLSTKLVNFDLKMLEVCAASAEEAKAVIVDAAGLMDEKFCAMEKQTASIKSGLSSMQKLSKLSSAQTAGLHDEQKAMSEKLAELEPNLTKVCGDHASVAKQLSDQGEYMAGELASVVLQLSQHDGIISDVQATCTKKWEELEAAPVIRDEMEDWLDQRLGVRNNMPRHYSISMYVNKVALFIAIGRR